MPFKEKWSEHLYKEIISKNAISNDISPLRADEMFGRNVLDDIWKGIYESRFVIADISVPSENVFYELGIAHTMGKKAILLSQNIERVPFDLRNQRIIVYSDDSSGYRTLNKELPKHIASILDEPIDEVHSIRSNLGGYMVSKSFQRISLFGDNNQHAYIEDIMDIIATRDNVVLINKQIDHEGVFKAFQSNFRHVYNTKYPNQLKTGILFDEPYLHLGDDEHVEISFELHNGFKDENTYWEYDFEVEAKHISFELVCPISFNQDVKLIKRLKSSDFPMQTIEPVIKDDKKVYLAEIKNPDLQSIYAIKWY
ncbi:MAG: hypothetical protein JXR19_07215 [Bacteroidia bacterium]